MSYLQDYYEKLSTEQLKTERFILQRKIKENDERLTTDSSADLDYNLDKQEVINTILMNRPKEV